MLAFIALISGLSVFDWNQIKVGAATEGPNDPLYLASEGNWGLNGLQNLFVIMGIKAIKFSVKAPRTGRFFMQKKFFEEFFKNHSPKRKKYAMISKGVFLCAKICLLCRRGKNGEDYEKLVVKSQKRSR